MRISLAYSWLFTLLLILINIFQINFLLLILSFNLDPPDPDSWLCHCFEWAFKLGERQMTKAHQKKKKNKNQLKNKAYLVFKWRQISSKSFIKRFSSISISIYIYISKSWSVTFIVSMLILCHLIRHVINHIIILFLIFFYFWILLTIINI